MRMVDPPNGWRYGFPKACPDDRWDDMEEWLIEQGYPQAEKDKYVNCFMVRCWDAD